jgi:hypothetical protein
MVAFGKLEAEIVEHCGSVKKVEHNDVLQLLIIKDL